MPGDQGQYQENGTPGINDEVFPGQHYYCQAEEKKYFYPRVQSVDQGIARTVTADGGVSVQTE